MNATSKFRRLFNPGWTWIPVVLVFAGLIAGVYLAAPESHTRAEVTPIPEYSVRLAQRERVQLSLRSQGIARARHHIPLSLQSSGEIIELDPAFESGRWVEAGQTLARLDPEPFVLDVAQYEHQVSAARLHLQEVEANAVVARRNASSKATDFALFKPQLSEARARLASAESTLQMARRRLRQSVLVAPFSGRLEQVSVSAGQQIGAGEPLGRLYSTPEVRLPVRDDWLQLLDADLMSVQASLEVPVILRGSFGGRERVWPAMITRREGGLNRNQMTWLIAEVAVDPGTLPLEPGVYVEAEIQGAVLDDVFVLPREALVGKSEVWVLDDGERLRRKPVQWTHRDQTNVYVTAGLEVGELVLEQGHRHLLEGARGRPASAKDAAGAETSTLASAARARQ
ncbi:MAG: efflux transporter periplasmic adaptor subunit [Alteromonadaceae bacterium]|nr:efflux transporter periplasmic adaptor subunit [Alteromonadaceae bacterium]